MPTIRVEKDYLRKNITEIDNIEDFLFRFGLEIDDEVIEDGISYYKIELPANRYDLFNKYGLLHALRTFLDGGNNKEDFGKKLQTLRISDKSNFIVKNQSKNFIGAVVIKNINLKENLQTLIDFQELLHYNLGRDRKYIAIGFHDFNKIEFPLIHKPYDGREFETLALSNVKLTENTTQDSNTIHKLKCDKRLSKYIKNDVYMTLDKRDEVVSLPPVIHSEYSKIEENTTSLLIESTGNDQFKINLALELIVSFLIHSNPDCEVYQSTIESPQNNGIVKTPKFEDKVFYLTKAEIDKELDIKQPLDCYIDYLFSMMYDVKIEIVDKKEQIRITVPYLRPDVIHNRHIRRFINSP